MLEKFREEKMSKEYGQANYNPVNTIVTLDNGTILKGLVNIRRANRLSEFLIMYREPFIVIHKTVGYEIPTHIVNVSHILDVQPGEGA